MSYTTDDLVSSMKKRGVFPTSQQTFQTSDLVRFLDEELTNKIVPLLMSIRENFFLKIYDQSIVSGTDQYEIHPRAIGMKCKNIYYVDASGNLIRLIKRELDELPDLETTSQTGQPHSFYYLDNYVKILPVPSTSAGTLRQYYYERRNSLVSVSDCGTITAINTGTKTVTINSAPTTFTSAVLYDLVKGTPGFQNLAIDQSVVVTGTSLAFSSTLPTTLAVGDYVCLQNQSPIPQVPYELHPVLAQLGVIRVLRGINDIAGSKTAKEDVDDMFASVKTQLAVRAEDQPKKIVSSGNISNYVFSSSNIRGF